MGLRRVRGPDDSADPADGARLAGVVARRPWWRIPPAGRRPGRPRHRVSARAHGIARCPVRRPRTLLPGGGDALGPASDLRRHQVRDGGRVDRGVRTRARRAPDQRTGTDGPSPPVPARLTREPSFVLASGGSAVIAEGVHTAFPKIAEARAALASHSAPIILGALPFDMSKPAALIRPQAIQFLDALPDWPLRALPSVQVAETLPEPDEHRSRIAT